MERGPEFKRRDHARAGRARGIGQGGLRGAVCLRAFGFVGTTLCYAFMQATGMVDDHIVTCFRHGK